MTVDAYGQVNISIQDGFGNTLISKDEAAGTWTESTYEYGSEDNGGSETEETEDDVDEEKEETSRLLEEKHTHLSRTKRNSLSMKTERPWQTFT